MDRVVRHLLWLLVAGVAVPCGRAGAQAPGYDQIDTRRLLAEFHAEVLGQINQVQARWGASWAADDLGALLDEYWEEAVVLPADGQPLRGRAELQEFLQTELAGTDRIEAFMLDFDASGGMAVVYGNYLIEAGGEQRTGPLVTVYLRRGRTWKIRSQVFKAP